MQLPTILPIFILAYLQTQTRVQAAALPEPLNVVINIDDSSHVSPSPLTHLRNGPVHAQCYSAGSDCFSDDACCWNWCKWSLGSFPGTCQGQFKPGSVQEEESLMRGGM